MLCIDNITVCYPRLRRPALEQASLTLEQGEIVALLGPNGAGKTTLMKVICGLVKPLSGRVWVAGVDATASPEAARQWLSLLIHGERSFYYRLSGFQNLLFFAGMENLFGRRARERIAVLLERFGLTEVKDQPFMKYSLGMRKKLALARALLRDPELLLLDEPTANLDPTSVREVLSLLEGLRDEGKTILLATHQLHEAERVADRVAMLNAGRLLACEPLAELKSRYQGPKLKLTLATGALPLTPFQALPGVRSFEVADTSPLQVVLWLEPTANSSELLSAIGALDLPITQMSQTSPTLEEVFLEAVA